MRAQQESTRLRERLLDFDFFKGRVEELQKENSNLYDARAALETVISANRIRLAGMNDQVSTVMCETLTDQTLTGFWIFLEI